MQRLRLAVADVDPTHTQERLAGTRSRLLTRVRLDPAAKIHSPYRFVSQHRFRGTLGDALAETRSACATIACV